MSYAYNAQGQETYRKDQAGTVLESVYDDSGRRTINKATTLGSGIDGAVRRIETGYDSLGRTSTIVQYDATSSGAATDGVAYAYDDWGNLVTYEEDRDSAVSGGGNQYTTTYSWTEATAGRYTLRKTGMTMPDSRAITYTYRTVGGLHDDEASRVSTVVDSVTLAQYDYMGAGSVVRTKLNEIACMSRVYNDSNTIIDLDLFNRITTNRWTKDLGTDRDFYQVALAYDRDSNITSAEDNVHVGYDVKYSMDSINRLTQAEEGTLSGGSITSKTRDEQWTLNHTGNWDREKLNLNGDADFTDSGELDDTRTHNAVNELTARDTDSNSSNNYTLTYDAAGNMIDDGKDYEYVYDAWDRLRKVNNTSNQALIAEYRYNGLNHRIGVHEDMEPDGDVDANDSWYYDAFDERWRQLARYRGSDSNPKEDFVPHQAGASGLGGSSYIDLAICRNKDKNTAWTTASDGVLEERLYLCQNWRADVSAIVSSGGAFKEWVKYSAYGTPIGLPGGDTDSDTDSDGTDVTQVNTWRTATPAPIYDVRGDIDLDGDVDATDESTINSSYSGITLGRGSLSATGVVSRKGNAGYEALSGLAGGKWLARNRALTTGEGRWLQRDPLSYVDGMSLYELMKSSPHVNVDADGYQVVGTSGPNQPRITRTPVNTPAVSNQGCGGFEIEFQFGLAAGTQSITASGVCGSNTGGYIVQEFWVQDYFTTSCPSLPITMHYWEAFPVGPNESGPASTDLWRLPFMHAIGDRYVAATARFVCDGNPQANEIHGWETGAENGTWSGSAQSTWTEPSFWNQDSSGVAQETWNGGEGGVWAHVHIPCCPPQPPPVNYPIGPGAPTGPSTWDPPGPPPPPSTGHSFPTGPHTGGHFQ